MKKWITCCVYLLGFLCSSDGWAQEAPISARVNGIDKSVSVGTGFFISNDGYVMTANHVIQKRDKVLVKLRGNLLQNATIVKVDVESVLALLKITASERSQLTKIAESLVFYSSLKLDLPPKFIRDLEAQVGLKHLSELKSISVLI